MRCVLWAARPVGAALALALTVVAARAAPDEHTVAYLYIEANENGAAGGHVALALDDLTFHFQRERGGWLRLTREETARFEYVYSKLENRTIQVQRIAASDTTFERLRDGFNRRFLIQSRQLETLEGLRTDAALLAAFLAARRGAGDPPAGALRIPAAGYFYGADGADAPGVSAAMDRAPSAADPPRTADDPAIGAEGAAGADRAALHALRTRIAALRGGDFVGSRIAQLERDLADIPLPDGEIDGDALRADVAPELSDAYSQRYLDGAARLLALEALRDERQLRADAIVPPRAPELALRADEVRALASFAEATERELAALVASDRPGSGYALLVGMARLAALQRSVGSGRLTVLDAYSSGARVLRAAELERRADLVPALLAEATAELSGARAQLAAAELPAESAYAELEGAANRFAELRAGVAARRDVRVQDGPLLPAREADPPRVILPAADAAQLATALEGAQRAERRYRAAIERLYGYALVGHNCVSELFRGIDAALSGPGSAERAALGAGIDADGPLAVIPFVSAEAVAASLPVVSTTQVPSYRRVLLAELAARDGAAAVALRESNTLSATIYRRAANDSNFLFFTDDAVALRPLFGLANLAVGAGAAVLGLAIAPSDGGAMLLRSLRGLVASAPELVRQYPQGLVRLRAAGADGGRSRRPRPLSPSAERPSRHLGLAQPRAVAHRPIQRPDHRFERRGDNT